MKPSQQCPNCGSQLRKRTSKSVGTLREVRRECKTCDYADVVLVRPEEIISVVSTTTARPQTTQHPLG